MSVLLDTREWPHDSKRRLIFRLTDEDLLRTGLVDAWPEGCRLDWELVAEACDERRTVVKIFPSPSRGVRPIHVDFRRLRAERAGEPPNFQHDYRFEKCLDSLDHLSRSQGKGKPRPHGVKGEVLFVIIPHNEDEQKLWRVLNPNGLPVHTAQEVKPVSSVEEPAPPVEEPAPTLAPASEDPAETSVLKRFRMERQDAKETPGCFRYGYTDGHKGVTTLYLRKESLDGPAPREIEVTVRS